MVRARRGCSLVRAFFLSDTRSVSYFVLTYKVLGDKIRLMSYINLYRLKEHRKRRGLTQQELAILSGVSRPTIAALELGYRSAYPGTTQKLAKALKVRPEYLLDPGH